MLDDALFGYEPVGLLTEKLFDYHKLVIFSHGPKLDTSAMSIDSIARMQDFLPFALASLRAGKNLLSLNLFFLILNCRPLLGTMDLLKTGFVHFLYNYTQLSCLWFVKRVYCNWILGCALIVDIPVKGNFFYMESHCINFELFLLNILIPI